MLPGKVTGPVGVVKAAQALTIRIKSFAQLPVE